MIKQRVLEACYYCSFMAIRVDLVRGNLHVRRSQSQQSLCSNLGVGNSIHLLLFLFSLSVSFGEELIANLIPICNCVCFIDEYVIHYRL